MRKENASLYPMGMSLLFSVFLTLCLVLISVFSFSSAASEEKRVNASVERKTAYYEANNKAQKLISSLDEMLSAGTDINDCSLDGFDVNVYEADEKRMVSLNVPFGSEQMLDIRLEIYTEDGNSYLRICQWKSISLSEWNPDLSINVLK